LISINVITINSATKKSTRFLQVAHSYSNEFSDEEKLVLNLLKEKSPLDLNELKGQTGLSIKKWDKTIKGLWKHPWE
jgi:hypothetical protein